MRVLLTRAVDAAPSTAAALVRAGFQPVQLPLVRIIDLGNPVPAGNFDAYAFTSPAAAEIIGKRLLLPSQGGLNPGLPAFCVGAATASSARRAGFVNVRTGGGNAALMAQTLDATRVPGKSRPALLYFAPRHQAFDLETGLQHWLVTKMLVHDAVLIDPGGDAFRAAIDKCDAVLLYSPRTAAHLCQLARRHESAARLAGLTLVAISEKTAEALTEPARQSVHIADAPSEPAMIKLLCDIAGRS